MHDRVGRSILFYRKFRVKTPDLVITRSLVSCQECPVTQHFPLKLINPNPSSIGHDMDPNKINQSRWLQRLPCPKKRLHPLVHISSHGRNYPTGNKIITTSSPITVQPPIRTPQVSNLFSICTMNGLTFTAI